MSGIVNNFTTKWKHNYVMATYKRWPDLAAALGVKKKKVTVEPTETEIAEKVIDVFGPNLPTPPGLDTSISLHELMTRKFFIIDFRPRDDVVDIYPARITRIAMCEGAECALHVQHSTAEVLRVASEVYPTFADAASALEMAIRRETARQLLRLGQLRHVEMATTIGLLPSVRLNI